MWACEDGTAELVASDLDMSLAHAAYAHESINDKDFFLAEWWRTGDSSTLVGHWFQFKERMKSSNISISSSID